MSRQKIAQWPRHPEWGECYLEDDTGFVTEHGDTSKRNVRIAVRSDNRQLIELRGGLVDTRHLSLPPLGAHIKLRIVVHRLSDAPAGVPIDELAPRQKVREVVAWREEPLGAQPQPPVSDSPAAGGAQPPASDSTPAEAPEPAAASRTARENVRTLPAPAPATPPVLGAASEERPWEERNSDGRLNFGSYTFQAATSAVALAVEVLGPDGEDAELLARTARLLLWAADSVQRGLRPDGRVNRSDNSHPRARGAVAIAARHCVMPEHGDSRDAWRAWIDQVAQFAALQLKIATEMTEAYLDTDRQRASA